MATGARSPQRRLAGAWRPRLGVALRCTMTSAKGRGDRAVAHLGSDRPAKWRRTASDDVERRCTDSVREEGR
jgi:hypothetical protein